MKLKSIWIYSLGFYLLLGFSKFSRHQSTLTICFALPTVFKNCIDVTHNVKWRSCLHFLIKSLLSSAGRGSLPDNPPLERYKKRQLETNVHLILTSDMMSSALLKEGLLTLPYQVIDIYITKTRTCTHQRSLTTLPNPQRSRHRSSSLVLIVALCPTVEHIARWSGGGSGRKRNDRHYLQQKCDFKINLITYKNKQLQNNK